MADAAGHNAAHQPVRAPRGPALSCKGWQQEAVLRMLMNSLDLDVADPQDSIADDTSGEDARALASFAAITAAIRALEDDETLVVRAGKLDRVLRTRSDAPRVVIIDAHSAGWDYIGPQGLLPAANELLAAAGRKYFSGDLAGKFVASCGMGSRGGALSLAAVMNGAAFLGIDADAERIKRRVKTGYTDVMVNDLDEALRILKNAVRKREPAAVGLVAHPARLISEMASRGVVPDLLVQAEADRDESDLAAQGVRALETSGTILIADADSAYRALGLEDGSAVRCIALSGEMSDIQRIDKTLLALFPADDGLARFLRVVQRRVRHQGLPARACWLDAGEQRKLTVALDELAANGELKAPVLIARDDAFRGATASVARQNEPPVRRRDIFSNPNEIEDVLKEARGSAWIAIHETGGLPRITASAIVADGTRSSSIEHAFD
jgi:urocanate hydratase